MLKKLKSILASFFGFICQRKSTQKKLPRSWNEKMLKAQLLDIAASRGLKFNTKATKVVILKALKESEDND